MSFTSEAKQELLKIELDKDCCRVATLSALLAVNGHLSLSSEGIRLVFQTGSLPLARKAISYLKRLYEADIEVLSKKGVKLQKQNQYVVIVKERVTMIVRELGLMDEERGYAQYLDDAIIFNDCCKRAFLRGLFLASGSINSPRSSSYHLEVTVSHRSFAEDVQALFNHFELKAKVHEKKQRVLVYIKDSERIADFLRIIGASQALFNFEDERIKRDFVNSITRVMNMEIANQNKTFEAAEKQLKDIAILENILDVESLSEGIKEAIELRKQYPEASLNELSEMSERELGKRLSKSALNHRFRNIAQKAREALEAYYEE